MTVLFYHIEEKKSTEKMGKYLRKVYYPCSKLGELSFGIAAVFRFLIYVDCFGY